MQSLIAVPLAIAFALFGRWVQLNPEKLPPRGSFQGPDSSMAKLYRQQVAVLGTFAVFAGVCGTVLIVLQRFTFGMAVLNGIAVLLSVIIAIGAAVRVRREVKATVRYVPGEYGLWP